MKDRASTEIERVLRLHPTSQDRDEIVKAITKLHSLHRSVWTVADMKDKNLELRVSLLSGMVGLMHYEYGSGANSGVSSADANHVA